MLLTCLFLCSSFLATSAFGQLQILEKADSLLSAGDTTSAIHELERYCFYIGETKEATAIRYQMATLEESQGNLRAAIRNYEAAIDYLGLDWTYLSSLYRSGLCYFLLGEYETAIEKAELPYRNTAFPDLRRSSAVLLIFANNHLGNWAESEAIATNLFAGQDDVLGELEHNYAMASTMKMKKEKTAKILSRIFPGLGMLYVGKPGKAAVSAAFNLSLAALAIYGIASERYLLALFTGVPWFLKFNGGGSRYAQRLAREHNNEKVLEVARRINLIVSESIGD